MLSKFRIRISEPEVSTIVQEISCHQNRNLSEKMIDSVIEPTENALPMLIMPELTSENFHYTLEAPTSGSVPIEMDPMTYLNRDKVFEYVNCFP